MVMVADLLPKLKRFLAGAGLKDAVLRMVSRIVITFLLHSGRMSCLQAAGAVRSDTRHRAQVGRMLKRPSFRRLDLTSILRQQLLELESAQGLLVFVVDATLVGEAGQKTENTYSTGNRKRRPKKGRRYGKYKHAKKSCHSHTGGLLITPRAFAFRSPSPTGRASTARRRGSCTVPRPKRRPT